MPMGNYGEVMYPPRSNMTNVPTYLPNQSQMMNQRDMRSQPTNTRLQDQFRQVVPINGYIVSDLSDIAPRDVPMDGSVSWFPKEDFTCIWARMWNKDGQLLTFKFVEEVPNIPVQNQVNQTDEFQSTLMQRLDEMQKSLEETLANHFTNDTVNKIDDNSSTKSKKEDKK